MKKLKRFFILLLLIFISLLVYVEIINWNSKNMTYRQKFLKAVYPAWMWFTKLTGKNSAKLTQKKEAPVSFYTLNTVLNNNDTVNFSSFQGKKILLVNTASNCGYTNQYNDLQQLANQFIDSLLVIGFPANDFKEQEKGTDEEIAEFCKVNFGVTFPLAKKSVVIKSAEQNPVFQWLSDPAKNGWNSKAPTWNFSKYLVNEKGQLVHYFDPSISPVSEDVIKAIKQN